jgi:hypothetical protein
MGAMGFSAVVRQLEALGYVLSLLLRPGCKAALWNPANGRTEFKTARGMSQSLRVYQDLRKTEVLELWCIVSILKGRRNPGSDNPSPLLRQTRYQPNRNDKEKKTSVVLSFLFILWFVAFSSCVFSYCFLFLKIHLLLSRSPSVFHLFSCCFKHAGRCVPLHITLYCLSRLKA